MRPIRAILPPVATLMLACATLLSAAPAPAATFADGDLYLMSRQLPVIGQAILRVDPVGGGTSTLLDLPDADPLHATFSYDAYRDRLLFVTTSVTGVRTVDAAGVVAEIATGALVPTLVAARGDGIIYLWIEPGTGFRYVDASNGVHDLLDAGGAATFTLPIGTQLQEMIYDPGTNSLLCLSGNPFAPCTTAGQTCCVRVPLTPDGTQVAGALSWTQVDVSTVSVEDVDGASPVPGGSILVIVDSNDNLLEPRMQMLDPAAMTFTAFASNGPYTGAAATDAGAWSTVQGRAVILDTLNDVLRTFGSGETGTGTVFATGVSGSGSAEDARLVRITRPVAEPAAGAWGLLGLASALAVLASLALKRRFAAVL